LARHGEPTTGRNIRRAVHGDQGVGVARVGDDQRANIVCGVIVNGAALFDKDRGVILDHVGALHALTAWFSTDQDRPIGIFEGDFCLVGRHDVGQQRERAVFQLHHDAAQRILRLGDFENLQDDRLIGAECLAICQPVQQAVTNLTGPTGHCHTNRCLHVLCSLAGITSINIRL
jgi:hypothetical protein